jgi:integrase
MKMSKSGTYQPSIGIGTLFPRGKKGTWYFEHKAEGIRASLGTSDPLEAETVARKRFGYLLAGNHVDQLAEVKVRLEVAEGDSEAARRQTIPLEEQAIWTAYLRQLSLVSVSRRHADGTRIAPLSPRTLRQCRSSLAKFLTWYDFNGKGKAMHNVTRTEAKDFFADLLVGGAKYSSYNRYRADLSVIWGRLSDQIATESPFLAVPPRKAGEVAEDTAHKQPFTADELATIHERATGWLAVAVTIGEETGLRLGDVVTLEVVEVDGDHIVRNSRKGKKDQIFYSPVCTAMVREWLGTESRMYVFPEQAKRYLGLDGFKRNSSAATKEFMSFLRDTCKIETGDEAGQTIKGFHSLRVVAATRTANLGGNAQNLLGHSDSRVTAGYIQPTLAEAKEASRVAANPLEAAKRAFSALGKAERAEFAAWLMELLKG